MAIQGLRSTDAFNTPSGRRPENYREGILMLYPNGAGVQSAPLSALTAVMKSEKTDDPVFHWFEKRLKDRRFALGANLTAPAAGTVQTITVASGALGLKAGDVLQVENTGEIVYVNATPTTDTSIDIVRGFDGAAPVAVTYNGAGVNPNLVCIGSAFEEGSGRPDPISFDPTEQFNQTQIFRGAYSMTGTAAATRTRTGDEVKESKREALEYFEIDMERAFLFGKKYTTARNGQPLRLTNGIINQIPAANKFTPGSGQLSYGLIEDYIKEIFRYGSTEKVAFCGMTALTMLLRAIRLAGQVNFELTPTQKEYGMDVRRLLTPSGTLVLKVHPLFSQMQGGTTGGTAYTSWDNNIAVLDMDKLKYRFVQGRDKQFQQKLEMPGEDALYSGYLAESGLQMVHTESFGLIQGIKSAVA